MSTIIIPSNTLRETKRLFGRLKHTRSRLPILTHILVTSDHQGIRLAVTDLDLWLEIQVSTERTEPTEPSRFLIPPEAMERACRADRGTLVTFQASTIRKSHKLTVSMIQGGIEVSSVHPTLPPQEYPDCPVVEGESCVLPPATLHNLATVAGCASTDVTRQILNGVFFTPEGDEGKGRLVASDGRRLASAPSIVPPLPFILPGLSAAILGHPGFTADLATVHWDFSGEPENHRVCVECGPQRLITKTIVGTYPDFQQVIPRHANEIVVVPHDRRPGVIAWLRSFQGNTAVRLDWTKRGQLTLSKQDTESGSAVLHVPVEIHGNPPVIAFNATYLADGLEIGSTLCLSDELSPGICRHPTGRFCVIMPMRVTMPQGGSVTHEDRQAA